MPTAMNLERNVICECYKGTYISHSIFMQSDQNQHDTLDRSVSSVTVSRDEKRTLQIGGFEEEKLGSAHSNFSLFICCLSTRILTPTNLLWLVAFHSVCSFRQQVS